MRALKFITGHVIYNPAYAYKFQLKTTKVKNVEIKHKILAMVVIFVIVITMIIGIHFGSVAPPSTKGMLY